ncbi:MAG: glycosyltransferase family 39 protein [Myxococcota bacterium]
MQAPPPADTAPLVRDPRWWHLLVLLALSVSFESLFVYHGMALLDEGWVLRAAQRLHEGGVLYKDVFFPFPPGHLLPAWIGYALDPPGVIAARIIDAGFNVALCLSLYLLARRCMPASFALLGAAMVALAAPSSHVSHYLFGYRYLVFSALALVAFAQRIDTGARIWMLASGALTGIALCFRLTPAVAVGCGVGLAIFAISRAWRDWLRDAAGFAAGIALVVAPVLAWFAYGVGLDVIWHEVIVRPAVMTALQSLPIPSLEFPSEWHRVRISRSWTTVQFRLYALLYLGYWLALVSLWVRALLQKRRFEYALLLAVVTWGGVFFTRVIGRSDAGHLESAIPPVCLVIAHLVYSASHWLGSRWPLWRSTPTRVLIECAVLAGWIFLFGTDRFVPVERRGTHRIQAGDSAWFVRNEGLASAVSECVAAIRELSEPGDTVFDLSVAPMFHLFADRGGVSRSGIVIPGTFITDEEEIAALEELQESPPAVVIVSLRHFDGATSRSIGLTAPRITQWVGLNYVQHQRIAKYLIMTRRAEPLSLTPSQ